MRLRTRAFERDEWTALIDGFADGSLVQTWEYAEAKVATDPVWQVDRAEILDEGGAVVGAVQAMVRPLIPATGRFARVSRIARIGGGLVWINRGPLLGRRGEPWARDRLVEAMAAVATAWTARRFYVRCQPPVSGPLPVAAPGTGGAAAGPLRSTGRAGWASARLDLGRSEADLRRGLKQKWRNVLNRAERSGLVVVEGSDDALFAGFLAAHRDFVAARGFDTSLTPALLARMQALLPAHRRMTVLAARLADGTPAGSVLVGRYGTTAEYLAGNLTEAGRRAGAGQVLLWRALLAARAAGAATFDLGGMDDGRTPAGIYHFKAETGATPYRLVDEVEADGGDPVSRLVGWRVRRVLGAADTGAGQGLQPK